MKQQTVIKAAVRNEKGKGSARKLRSKEIIPAVLYGHKVDPVMLTIIAEGLPAPQTVNNIETFVQHLGACLEHDLLAEIAPFDF